MNKYLSQHKKVQNGRWVFKLIYVQLEFISEVYFKGGTSFSEDFLQPSKLKHLRKTQLHGCGRDFCLKKMLPGMVFFGRPFHGG